MNLTEKPGQLASHLREQARHLEGLRILVAEDDSVNQLVIGNFFQIAGVVFEMVKNGQEAVELMKKQDFDLVLMDVHMPVMDGLTATRQIRQDPKLRKIPILALTAGVTREEKDKALDAGLNDFIVKPFDHLTLLDTLTRWVRT